jgi:acetoin utilization deacetylase AcuC-like enzyme
MDPHPSISAEGLAERERRVATWCADHAMPVAWVLAGGYTWSISMGQLVDLHLHTVTAFATTNSDRLSQAVPSLRSQAANTFLAHNGNARNNHITRNEPKT